jgi:hypothetical protein|tara:strand:+ start:7140 stop:7244 length:105 start_codon:yes stop_codon:yes gene_type:complete
MIIKIELEIDTNDNEDISLIEELIEKLTSIGDKK